MMSLAQVPCPTSPASLSHSHSFMTRCPIQVEEDLRKYQELLRNDPFASPEDTPPAGEQSDLKITPHVAITAPDCRNVLPLLPVPRCACGKGRQGQPLAASSRVTRQGTRQRQPVICQHAAAGNVTRAAVACVWREVT